VGLPVKPAYLVLPILGVNTCPPVLWQSLRAKKTYIMIKIGKKMMINNTSSIFLLLRVIIALLAMNLL
jgi:hypothetical protein